jgi:hypothetical protein
MAWRLHADNRYQQLPNPFSGSVLKHFRISSGCADCSTRSVENANVRYRPAGTNKKQKHINSSSSCVSGETGYRSPHGGYFYWLRAVRMKGRCWDSGRRKRVFCATKRPDRQQDQRSLPFGGRRGPFSRGKEASLKVKVITHHLVLRLRMSGLMSPLPPHMPSRCVLYFHFPVCRICRWKSGLLLSICTSVTCY